MCKSQYNFQSQHDDSDDQNDPQKNKKNEIAEAQIKTIIDELLPNENFFTQGKDNNNFTQFNEENA